MQKLIAKLTALENDAKKFGFYWPNTDMIIENTIDEANEVKDALAQNECQNRIQEEVGDLIYSAFSLSLFLGLDPKETLQKATDKFELRFETLKKISQENGLQDLEGKDIKFMMDLWKQAKIKSKKDVDQLLGL